MNGIEIVTPGPLTTVQDLGRFGYQRAGFCPSGVMDVPAALIANALVGNKSDADEPMPAVLEMTMQGIVCVFHGDAAFALTGADMPATLNDKDIPSYALHYARSGDTLSIGFARAGCRGYLAFAGGIDVPPVMGSRSTNIKCALGGFEGRKLKRGDMLALYGVGGRLKPRKPVYAEPQHAYTSNGAPLLIRVADGPQIERFSKETIRKFQNAQYTVSVQSDRMGVRLDGEPLPAIGGADIVSDGIPCGAVQVSNAGQPMILLADRQTVGGYAKPFVVIEADLPLLAQARPGDKLRFARVSIRNAQFAALETIADTGLTLRRIDEQYTGSLRFAGFNIKT